MNELSAAIDVTIAGMGVVLITLAVLALLVKGLGAIAGDRRPDRTEDKPVRQNDNDDGDMEAAAVAAVLAVLTEQEQSELPGGQQLSGWVSGARIDAVQIRTRFADRKEHQSWRERSR